jgi:hypothetical protein
MSQPLRYRPRARRAGLQSLLAGVVLAVVLLLVASRPALDVEMARAATDSGVSGQVRLDRPCGIRAGGCGSRRVAATVVVRERSTHRRVRTLHMRHGRFRARLQPGRYTLTARSAQSPRAATRNVVVEPDRFKLVVLHLQAPERFPR